MAEILTQRALVTAKIETTFGVDASPSPSTDALLVSEPDYSVDMTVIERNFARQSLTPLPVAAGRKIATMTFNHEVRGNGDTGTAPQVGVALRGCGFAETQVTVATATGGRADVTADTGNGGPTVTWADGGTMAVLAEADYRMRVTLGGASATASIRVTGGNRPDDLNSDSSLEEPAIRTETYSYEPISTSGDAPTVDDTTDPESIEYDWTGTTGYAQDDTFRVIVQGLPFLITVTDAAPTATDVGDDVAAAISAHPLMSAVNTTGSVAVTFSGVATGTVVTSGTTGLVLGASGLTATPTWTGSLVLNDGFTAVTKPIGWEYTPVSTGFESLTVYMYFDGVLHKLTGARGTFTVEGTGGDLANFGFTFTGNYEDVTDVALPAATFETQIPVQVELSQLTVNPWIDNTTGGGVTGAVEDTWENQPNGETQALCAASFGYDHANEINPRECIQAADAYNGVVLVNRAPTGNMDPELELVATHDFWNLMAISDVMHWRVRVGTEAGNLVRFESDSAQYAGLSYADRNGLRVLEVDLRFSGTAPNYSDDEILIAFN